MKPLDQFPFNFYGETFALVFADDRRLYVPLRRLCEALGINYSSQRKRVLRDEAISDALVNLALETPYQNTIRIQQMSCLWLNRMPYWLGTIDTGRVKEELRGTIIRYKREFAEVAWAAFRTEILPEDVMAELDTHLPPAQQEYHKLMDQAASLRQNIESQGTQLETIEARLTGLEARLVGTDFINPAQQRKYLDMVNVLGETMKKKKAGNQAIVHNTVKTEFQVPSYQLIPERSFTEVVKFMSRWYQRITPPGTTLPYAFTRPEQGRLI